MILVAVLNALWWYDSRGRSLTLRPLCLVLNSCNKVIAKLPAEALLLLLNLERRQILIHGLIIKYFWMLGRVRCTCHPDWSLHWSMPCDILFWLTHTWCIANERCTWVIHWIWYSRHLARKVILLQWRMWLLMVVKLLPGWPLWHWPTWCVLVYIDQTTCSSILTQTYFRVWLEFLGERFLFPESFLYLLLLTAELIYCFNWDWAL